MKKIPFILLCGLIVCFATCKPQNGPEEEKEEEKVEIEDVDTTKIVLDLTIENFPKSDCSTSTSPLLNMVAAKLLDIPYSWYFDAVYSMIWSVQLDYAAANISAEDQALLESKLACSTTHGSFVNLIDDKVEFIISSRSSSRDEAQYAAEKQVELIEKPVGGDALVFLVEESNPVKSLTHEQVHKIYTGEITNWSEVGGNDAPIVPFVREANSGSQEKFETMVMAGLNSTKWQSFSLAAGMAGPYYELYREPNGIAFSPYYYYSVMAKDMPRAHSIAINGVEPNKETIKNGTFPYVSNIYSAVRADVDKESNAYQLFLYMTATKRGQAIVEESGYVPIL